MGSPIRSKAALWGEQSGRGGPKVEPAGTLPPQALAIKGGWHWGGIDSKFAQKCLRRSTWDFPSVPTGDQPQRVLQRDAARCLKDGVTEPPAGKEARHRASAPRVCSGVASAVRRGVPGRLAPDLGFRRLDFLVFTIPTWAFILFRFSGSPWSETRNHRLVAIHKAMFD